MSKDDFAAYAATYARMHNLSPIDAEDEARMVMLAERAIHAGRKIPRVKDKAYEPIIDFKAADIVQKRGF
jgi:hypothetical protein